MAGNIQKSVIIWRRLANVLGREGADPKVSRTFYIAMTQQVLLFGAVTWVLTEKMENSLDAFQGRVARKLTGGAGPTREEWRVVLPVTGRSD